MQPLEIHHATTRDTRHGSQYNQRLRIALELEPLFHHQRQEISSRFSCGVDIKAVVDKTLLQNNYKTIATSYHADTTEMYAEIFVREEGRIYRSLLWFNTTLYLVCRGPKCH